jgi:hypothetical protein
MTPFGFPACPACSASEGWMIDSPVSATDRLRLDASGVHLLGLFPPEEGLEPLGHPIISCAACATIAEAEELRAAVLGAATTGSHTH